MRESGRDGTEGRNFVLNLTEGALYISSVAFISAQTVLPALVSTMGGNNVAVGAVGVIAWVGMFLPQIFAARYTETLAWKKPWAIWAGLSQRMVVLFLAAAVFVFGESSSGTALLLFFVLFSLNQILIGVATPGWFEMFTKLTPLHKRGRLVGLRNALAGVAAFLCGLVLTWLLGRFGYPLGYAWAFVFAFVLQMSSVIVQSQVVESEPSVVSPRKPFFSYLRQLSDVLKYNLPFKRFLAASSIQILATMPIGFYTVYAMSRFGAGGSAIGEFTLTIVGVQVISAPVIGNLADKHGNKIALLISTSALLCATLVALFAPTLGWFRIVFAFLGINLGTEMAARYNISVEFGPDSQRSTYIGLMNTILAPFYLSAILGGWLCDQFGYEILFQIGIVLSIVGLFLFLTRVDDPREPSVKEGRGHILGSTLEFNT